MTKEHGSTPGDDLSADEIGELRQAIAQGQIEEEAERRRWKTRLFRIGGTVIVIFYFVLIEMVIAHRAAADAPHIIVALAAVPTALAFGLMRMAAKPVRTGSEDEVSNPWLGLAKDALEILKSRAGS